MKFDTSGWREFRLSDLFELHLAKGDLQPKKLENGEIPLVSAGGTNNGIVMYIKNSYDKSEKFNSNVITIDMFGKAFYQNKDFFAVSHGRVNILKPKFDLNFHIGLFFVSLFDKKLLDNFSFTKMCSQGRLQKETIKLPIDSNGNPNFEFMENTIKTTQNKMTKIIKAYEIAQNEGESKIAIFASSLRDSRSESKQSTKSKQIDCHESSLLQSLDSRNDALNIHWREFTIGELFEIKPTKAYKMTNTTLFATKGNVPVVTNSSLNNGVSGYADLEPTEKGNMITYSDTTTSEGIFYQPRDFIGYSHIQGLYPLQDSDKWNKYALLYFVVLFRKASFGLFDYANKFNRQIAKQMTIKLPTNQNNEIAFDFMEKFISAVQKEVIQSVVLWSAKRIETTKAIVKNH